MRQHSSETSTFARMTPTLGAIAVAIILTGCAGTSRFDGLTSTPARPSPPAQTFQTPPPATALPAAGAVATAPVESQPLPPPSYPAGSPPPAAGQTATSDVPAMPPIQPAQPQPIGSGQGTQVATLGSGGGRGPVTNRDGVIGGWTAREANGSSCRVLLSSSPALDLYRASASGCANKELQKVTSWDYRDGEVYLYQPGGSVAARMRVNDGASLSGAVTRSGAGLTMSR